MEFLYSEVTKSIEIEVKPKYEEEYSSIQDDVYTLSSSVFNLDSNGHIAMNSNSEFVFSYTIKITNLGKDTVQLVDRHWLIHSGGKLIAEVQGEGVVGVQPVLEQGASHVYTSNVVIPYPEGSMEGSYRFVSVKCGGVNSLNQISAMNKENFLVKIPRFDLIYPGLLH